MASSLRMQVDWEKPQLPNNSVFLFNLGESRPIDFSYVFKKADDATVQKLEVVTAARGDFFSALTSGDSESAITVRITIRVVPFY